MKEVGFEVFPGRCDRGAISYLEGERVPKNRGENDGKICVLVVMVTLFLKSITSFPRLEINKSWISLVKYGHDIKPA